MRTQTDIENERAWTGIAALALLVVYAMVAIAYGYQVLLEKAAGHGPVLAHLIATVVIGLCLMPGICLWKYLRPHSKYAALYGLLVAAAPCWIIPQLVR